MNDDIAFYYIFTWVLHLLAAAGHITFSRGPSNGFYRLVYLSPSGT